MKIELFILYIFSFVTYITSHSWIDWIKCEDTGDVGYIRNYQGRDKIQDFDLYMTYLLEGRNKDDNICSPHQSENKYFPNYPKLTCYPGSKVIFKYNTNGHVITDQCLPGDPRGCLSNGHTADIYWSIHMNNNIYPNQLLKVGDVNNNPQFNDDSGLINYITKHQKFNFNNTCNHESSEPCIGEFTIPTDIVTNRDYQFIWYWILDRDYRGNGETYTSCWDINIISQITPNPCIKVTPAPIRPNCRTVIINP